jgi:hypothetical protein
MNNERPFLFDFKKIGNSSIGFISIVEHTGIPFPVKRVYWTYYTPHDVTRGNHAHHALKQVLVAVAGRVEVQTEERDGTRQTFVLERPNEGLFIPTMCWRTLQFSHTAVLLCLASEEFAEADYIRDYSTFKRLTHGA